MDDTKVGMRRVRSVKDVISLYDDRNHRTADIGSPSLKKTQMDFAADLSAVSSAYFHKLSRLVYKNNL